MELNGVNKDISVFQGPEQNKTTNKYQEGKL